MRLTKLAAMAVQVVAFTLALTQANAALVFDNASRGDFQSTRGAAFSPLADITVSTNVDINQIGAMVDLNADGNMRFVIFDLNTQALLLATASAPYLDTGLAFHLSPIFPTFTLMPGISYGIGAIADVGGGWETNNSSSSNPFTQGNITSSDDRNGNVSNFSSPTLGAEGSAMIMVQLYSPNVTAVPEPGALALMGLGLVFLFLVALRKRLA